MELTKGRKLQNANKHMVQSKYIRGKTKSISLFFIFFPQWKPRNDPPCKQFHSEIHKAEAQP